MARGLFMVRNALILLSLGLTGCIPAGVPDQQAAPVPANPAETPASPQLDTDMGAILASEPKAWSPAAVQKNAVSIKDSMYIVQAGDTLRGIGNRTGAGSEAIARANALTPPYIIKSGQKLTIPGGRYHLVTAGETGIAISRAYGVAWADVIDSNGLSEPFILRVGQRLRLPGDAEMTLEERAAAFSPNIDDIVTGSQPAIPEATRPTPPVARGAPGKPLGAGATGAIAEPSIFSGKFAWPISGPIKNRFGPIGNGKVNSGIDIAAPRGTNVRTAGPGVVSYAGDEISVYGGLVLITHGSGWVSAYGHLDRIDVVRGQKVVAGQIIGLSGATGQVQTPQLHFELRKNRKPIDPVTQLPAK
jgi:murein DD-endopeptidase MepM/ murein hydrolase activator NlpD